VRPAAAAGALNATRHGLGSGSRTEVERLAGAMEIRPLGTSKPPIRTDHLGE
jgi:hypothetical protein